MSKIKVNDININYKLEGNGKTIVFIHGLSDSLNYWNPLTKELKNNFQTLSFDLRAHGKSDFGNKEISIDLFTDDLYQLLNNLNIKKATIVGLSLGGNIALNFAIKHPEIVEGLIIMSSFSNMNNHLKEIFKELEKNIKIGFSKFYDNILPYTLIKEDIEENREKLKEIKFKASKTANTKGILAGIQAGYSFNITDKLNTINVSTLIITGKEDQLTTLEIQENIHKNIKNSEINILDKTKHNILIKRNIERVLESINIFMLKIN